MVEGKAKGVDPLPHQETSNLAYGQKIRRKAVNERHEKYDHSKRTYEGILLYLFSLRDS